MGGEVLGPPISICHKVSDDTVDIEAGVPVKEHVPATDRIRQNVLPSGEVVYAVHIGPYELLPEAEQAIDHWAEQNGRKTSAPCWQVYCTNPGEVPNPTQWKTEIYKPITG
jgi:AraC family transcriptional regulator